MQDDRQLAGDRDLRFGGAGPLGQTHAPSLQRRPRRHPCQQHIGGFEGGRAGDATMKALALAEGPTNADLAQREATGLEAPASRSDTFTMPCWVRVSILRLASPCRRRTDG